MNINLDNLHGTILKIGSPLPNTFGVIVVHVSKVILGAITTGPFKYASFAE